VNYTIDIEQEEDGRIIAEVLELPGVLAYGQTKEDGIAIAKLQALALHILADRLEYGEITPELLTLSFISA
jgi:predicted RNase H-like HicB family nuclease